MLWPIILSSHNQRIYIDVGCVSQVSHWSSAQGTVRYNSSRNTFFSSSSISRDSQLNIFSNCSTSFSPTVSTVTSSPSTMLANDVTPAPWISIIIVNLESNSLVPPEYHKGQSDQTKTCLWCNWGPGHGWWPGHCYAPGEKRITWHELLFILNSSFFTPRAQILLIWCGPLVLTQTPVWGDLKPCRLYEEERRSITTCSRLSTYLAPRMNQINVMPIHYTKDLPIPLHAKHSFPPALLRCHLLEVKDGISNQLARSMKGDQPSPVGSHKICSQGF